MATKSFDYTSMGFITFDCLGWPFTAIPPGGGCYLIDELTLAVSGAAGVAAIAAARMGLKTRAVGGVGEDLMGDWVLQRLLAGLPVTSADIRRLGAGGLLMEIVSRPQPRAGGETEAESEDG